MVVVRTSPRARAYNLDVSSSNRCIDDGDAREYCETLLRHFADKLTEWEDSFVRFVQGQLSTRGRLTDRQKQVLDSIMGRCARDYGKQGGGEEEDA